MGKVAQGILDGFYGKVGTVVGSFWKGIPLMRAYVRRIGNPNTDLQKVTRAKFALLGHQAGQLTPALRVGLKGLADNVKSTEQGEYMRLNYGTLTGDSPASLTQGWDELIMSMGTLPEVGFSTPSFTNPLEVSVTVTNANLDAPGAKPTDRLCLVAYCPDMGQAAFSLGVATRSDSSVTLHVPSMWQGMNVHVYGFLAPAMGEKDVTNCSMTTYIGFGNIS